MWRDAVMGHAEVFGVTKRAIIEILFFGLRMSQSRHDREPCPLAFY
jgi:hypothetical protein